MVIGAGVTLHEALKAQKQLEDEDLHVSVIDLFSVKPLDTSTLLQEAQRVKGRVVVVEDHYEAGGIGEAISAALSEYPGISIRRLCVQELPRSGDPDALMERFGISSKHIIKAVKNFS